MTQENILKALSNVQEPDLGKDLVTLNMVKDIVIDGNNVSFTVVLTTPACPLKELIKNACINAVKILVNKEADVWFAAGSSALKHDRGSATTPARHLSLVTESAQKQQAELLLPHSRLFRGICVRVNQERPTAWIGGPVKFNTHVYI